MTKAIRRDRIFIGLFPIVVALVSFFIFKFLFGKYNFEISATDGLDDCKLMLDIWGTLLGFLITAVSLFLTIGDGKYMNTLKSSGHFSTVLYSYVICCIHLFLAVVFALIVVFIKLWSMTVFSILCAAVIDTLIIVAICLVFLFFIVINNNK
jgi:hypothetical protein